MLLIDLLGAALTVVTVGLLLVTGTLAALVLRDRDEPADPLALVVAALLLATAEAVGIALLLGALGLLRLPAGLLALTLLLLGLRAALRRRHPDLALEAELAATARRAAAAAGRHLVLVLVALHAGAAEILRGLFRPPLSWDSLMYHLLLTATWLQEGNLAPVFGNIPVNYYGYVPANGSLWFWWWMAPSHSELWVNLAAAPHWLLLGLATGAVARELGARRHWPAAAALVMVLPTVVRFAAAEYVDLLLGSVCVAAFFFALRWLREPRWSSALLAGTGFGLASGTKVLGVAYALAGVGAVVVLARGAWRQRLRQLAAAFLCAALLGSYFYLRNIALGVDALALQCERTASGPEYANVPTIPRMNSVLALPHEMFAEGKIAEVFLGSTRPQSLELGVGPPVVVFLVIALLLPFALGPERRRAALFLSAQVWALGLFWFAVPFAANNHVFANVRYLIPALAVAVAAGSAMLEHRRLKSRWIMALALVFALQSLLQLHAEMPVQVRVLLAAADLVLVGLALSPRWRALAAARRVPLLVGATVLAVLLAPWLGRFRAGDRGRALATEFTVHATGARFFARGWDWLDQHGVSGTVASVGSPNSYFLYPGMGTHLERRVRYVNINRADRPLAAAYPSCEPRVDPDPAAWLDNLRKVGAGWVLLTRYPEFPFPVEDQWAAARPDRFALRFEDEVSRIYEVLDPSTAR